jgi:DNA modification methylase
MKHKKTAFWVYATKDTDPSLDETVRYEYGNIHEGHPWEWLPKVDTYVPIFTGVVSPAYYPARGALKREDGSVYRAQELSLALALHVVMRFTRVGERVWDPFAGTGAIGMACIRANRRCVSTELWDFGLKAAAINRAQMYWLWCQANLRDDWAKAGHPKSKWEAEFPDIWSASVVGVCVCVCVWWRCL